MPRTNAMFWVKLLAVVGIIALGLWLAELAGHNAAFAEAVAQFGYPGLFVLAIVSGFNLIVPIPAASFLPLVETAGLSVPIGVAVIVVGVSLADSLAYLLGKTGRIVIGKNDHAIMRRVAEMERRRPWLPPIILAAWAAIMPLPNEVLLIPFGLLGMKFRYLFPALLLGNAVFNSVVALGITSLASVA